MPFKASILSLPERTREEIREKLEALENRARAAAQRGGVGTFAKQIAALKKRLEDGPLGSGELPETTCTAWDTGMVKLITGACPRVLGEARKTAAALRKAGVLGQPTPGSHGRPVSVDVIEEKTVGYDRFARKIWEDGRPVSEPWRKLRDRRSPRAKALKPGERAARKLSAKKKKRGKR